MKPILTESFTALEVIPPRRFVVPTLPPDDGGVELANSATSSIHGVSDSLGAAAIGDRCDVHTMGLVEVEYGDVVTAGNLLTADANGKAVPALPLAGVNNRVGGVARVSGVAGDIGLVMLAPGQIQGA